MVWIFKKIILKNNEGKETNVFLPGEDLTVEVRYDASRLVEKTLYHTGSVGPNFRSLFYGQHVA